MEFKLDKKNYRGVMRAVESFEEAVEAVVQRQRHAGSPTGGTPADAEADQAALKHVPLVHGAKIVAGTVVKRFPEKRMPIKLT